MESLIRTLEGWPAVIASFIAVVGGVAKAFEWLDPAVSDAGRLALSNKLKDLPSDDQITSWGTVFPSLIDRVFGENPTSVMFINRSCQASGFAVLLVGIAYCRLNHDKLSLIGTLAFFALFANFFPDYMSLLVSRMIVKIMATRTSTKEIWLLLTGDTIATAFIALLSSFLAMLVLELSSYAETISWWKRTHGPDGSFTLYMFLHHWAGMLLWRASLKIRGWDWLSLRAPSGAAIFFYSAFFTSVWVWLYVLSLFLISLLHRGRTVWVKIAPYLDIEKKPLMAIGRVAGLVAGVAYSVLLGIVWLVRHWH